MNSHQVLQEQVRLNQSMAQKASNTMPCHQKQQSGDLRIWTRILFRFFGIFIGLRFTKD